MALDRLIQQTGTGPAVSSSIQEEVTGLWNRSICSLTGVGGSGNAITASLAPALTSGLVDGMAFWLTPTANNTGAATIAINGGSAVDIVDVDGNPLTSGQLVTGRKYLLVADGGDLRIVISGGTGGGSGYIRRVYTANDTWIKPDGLTSVKVTVRGAGGGSGGKSSSSASGTRYGGGGGGGGEAIVTKLAADLASSVTITVGAGGTAASTGGSAVGGTGGSSSFGTHAVATGGLGGSTSDGNSTNVPGGAGGAGTAGDILMKGQLGGRGGIVTEGSNGGVGGASPTGGYGPDARTSTGNGVDGLANTGAGATGAAQTTTSTATGGVGGSGLVIVEEFY